MKSTKKAGLTKPMLTAGRMPGEPDALLEDEHFAFFQLIYAIHTKAKRKAGGYQDRFFNIGGRPVRLRFAGPGLMPVLTPALAHLETPPVDAPQLTVLLWDSVSSGSEIPLMLSRYFDALGEWWIHLGRRGEIKEWTNERFHTAYHLGPNIFSMMDLATRVALYWVKDAQTLPYYEIGSPLRTILHWWAGSGACQFLHAGAVGFQSGGVLLAGKGGTGKSTAALACLEGGLDYASDDYCLFKADPQPTLYSVYNTAKLRGELDLERFPRLAPMVSNKTRLESDKALLFVYQHFPGRMCVSAPIRAILLPRVTQEKASRVTPATPAAALTALAPTTLMQLPQSGESAIKAIARLVHQVPAYFLDLGTDIATIPEAVKGVLQNG